MKKLRKTELTKAEQKKLISEICRICEKQYRKGYQHGFYAHQQGETTQNEVDQFREKGSLQGYKKVVHPPHNKRKENPIDRIFTEMAMKDMEILTTLFQEYL